MPSQSSAQYLWLWRNVINKPISPTLRILGAAIRRHREAAGLTQERLSELINFSKAWMSNVETGQLFPQKRDIIRIEKALNLAPHVLLDIFELIKYEEQPPGVASERYINAERRARIIRNYSALVVPDLLQTPDYARALITARHPTAKPEVIECLLRDRLKRQETLSRVDPPTLWLIVDEIALRRTIGGREVHCAQLDALIEAAQQPQIGLQVIPLCTGAHAGLMGSFTLLSFEDDPDVACTDDNEASHFRERPDAVRVWFDIFDALRITTLPATASLEMIQGIREVL
jgi:transcriptional regulator with XRE-family HTH domain